MDRKKLEETVRHGPTSEEEDVITIKIHGSYKHRQAIVDRVCLFMTEQAEKCSQEWGQSKWGWTLESSLEPILFSSANPL